MRNKFVLKSTSSFKSINQANTNKSKTKATFSFSKTPRFFLARPQCPKSTYNGDSVRRKNSGAGIGYGKKSDFTLDLTVSPGSTRYNMKTNFEENESKKRGYSLRKGRQQIRYESYIDRSLSKVPSADRYRNEINMKNKAPVYSMRKKTKVLDATMTIDNQNINPGPGTYDNPQIQLGSKASRFSRISYSSSKSLRFMNPDNKVPGPGTYKPTSNLSKIGKYVVSAHKGGTKAKFDVEKRKTKFDEASLFGRKVPGPGNYKSPSEFGQYDGQIYDQFNTINVARRERKRR